MGERLLAMDSTPYYDADGYAVSLSFNHCSLSYSGAPNEVIVQNHLNKALLDAF